MKANFARMKREEKKSSPGSGAEEKAADHEFAEMLRRTGERAVELAVAALERMVSGRKHRRRNSCEHFCERAC